MTTGLERKWGVPWSHWFAAEPAGAAVGAG